MSLIVGRDPQISRLYLVYIDTYINAHTQIYVEFIPPQIFFFSMLVEVELGYGTLHFTFHTISNTHSEAHILSFSDDNGLLQMLLCRYI